jgi:hypothetical protein
MMMCRCRRYRWMACKESEREREQEVVIGDARRRVKMSAKSKIIIVRKSVQPFKTQALMWHHEGAFWMYTCQSAYIRKL